MAGEIQKVMSIKAQIIDVGRGRFEVAVNGEVIFSKQKMGRKPRPYEITKIFKAKYR